VKRADLFFKLVKRAVLFAIYLEKSLSVPH
jgi:hypothetical protein